MSLTEKLVRGFYTVITITVCLIPLWIYLLARLFFSPEGFWQEFVLFGLGLFLLGFIQLILLIFLVALLHWLWVEKGPVRLGKFKF